MIDLSMFYAGPYSARILADLGAQVIKIEQPKGDPQRGMASPTESANRNKQAIAVDLKSPDGQAVFKRLVGDADVVIQSFRPGVAERLGVDYETACSITPDVI